MDDGCLDQVPMKMVKAMLDVGQFESMCWARWGATKWVKGEPRTIADQVYAASAEPKCALWPWAKFGEFYEMVRPAFHSSATPACIDAIFKRAAFLVNTKDWVYFRPSGVNQADVARKKMPRAGYLTTTGKKLYSQFKSGDLSKPGDFEQKLIKEAEWVDNAIRKNRALKKRARGEGSLLFPELDELTTVPLKRELPAAQDSARFLRLRSSASAVEIDLTLSPPTQQEQARVVPGGLDDSDLHEFPEVGASADLP